VVINFWASWCADCPVEAALLERVWAEERARGLVVVGIAVNEARPERGDVDDTPEAYVRRLRLTYPSGHDRDGDIANRFGVAGVPETFAISRDGRIVGRHVGPLTEAALQSLLMEAMAADGEAGYA
jgi:cytochrome c biogenesis protein CcmG/thiol:disulfide interchange protein DsbE